MSRRSPWVVLAVLSLVGSLLALAAGPVSGKNGEADYRALFSACPPGSALEDAGFRDMSSYPNEFEDAINCMANYGIMPGLLPGLFEPQLGVTRQQMALILIRAAYVAGIDVPTARDQGFRDIDDLSRETRDSINQLAQLRITQGTTSTTYTPNTVVNRRQMAQFFERFLALAPVGEGGESVDSVVADDTVFKDIDDLPHDPYDAIRTLYELGVTAGTSATTYGPDDEVTRAQMARFISRMLAHTNARPAGITMQVEETSVTAEDTVDLIIAVRNEDHEPVVDALVDLFYVARGDDGFVSNGRCGRQSVREYGDVRCQIDFGDESTDADGNLLYRMAIEEDLTVYAWTGERSDRFDIDSTAYASLDFRTSKSADGFLLTDDAPEGATAVPYGTTVTFTLQLVDEDERPVSEEDVAIKLEIREENEGSRPKPPRVRTFLTDSSGRIEIKFRLTDPDSGDDGDEGEVKIEKEDADVPEFYDRTKVRITEGGNVLHWSDEDGEAARLVLEERPRYTIASSGGSRNRVTVTLVDQYGDPVRNKRINFTSNDPDGLYAKLDDQNMPISGEPKNNNHRKHTSRTGVATVTYNRKSSATFTETIYVDVFNEAQVRSLEFAHYWVDEIPEEETIQGEVVFHDEDNDTLIIEDTGGGATNGFLFVVTYDENDVFPLNTSFLTYEEFKEALEEKDDLNQPYGIVAAVNSDDPDDVNSFNIS